MRSVILTFLLVALFGLSSSTAIAQNPPPTAPVDPAPEVCPDATSSKAKASKVSVTKSVAPARTQDPPTVPPVTARPQVRPAPKPPTKPKVKIKVRNTDEDEDLDADETAEQEKPAQTDQTVATASNVIVSFCGGTSNVIVRGWDRNEVHAHIDGGESVELKSYSNGDGPASKIEVMISTNHGRNRWRTVMCRSTGDLRLDVPRGSVVDLKSRQGDIDAENIARFRANTTGGSLTLRNIAKSVNAAVYSGDITVEKTKGPLSITSISGNIEIRDAEQADGGDGLDVNSISGDVSLSDCKFGQVDVNSVSGNLNWTGALANGGQYKFSNTEGDITLVMPANSSFRVTAQAAFEGGVSTDFALRSEGETSFKKIAQAVRGVYGTGSAQLEINTFNGTIRLRKK